MRDYVSEQRRVTFPSHCAKFENVGFESDATLTKIEHNHNVSTDRKQTTMSTDDYFERLKRILRGEENFCHRLRYFIREKLVDDAYFP